MFKAFWKKKRLWQICSVIVLMGFVIVFVACYSYIRGLDVSKLSQPLPESTLVLDKNGKPASQLSASKIEPVQFSQLPKVLTDAVVAVEDKRFYEHTGIDMRSIFRAVGSRCAARQLFGGSQYDHTAAGS